MTARGRWTIAGGIAALAIAAAALWPADAASEAGVAWAASPEVPRLVAAALPPARSTRQPIGIADVPAPAAHGAAKDRSAPAAPSRTHGTPAVRPARVSAPSRLPPVASAAPVAAASPRRVRDEWFAPPVSRAAIDALEVRGGRYERPPGPGAGEVRLRYTLDPALTEAVWRVLSRGRVALGHAMVMDANTGALYAYASTDPEHFPPQAVYPAASLVKVVTAAAALERAPSVARETCRYVGSPYKLTRRRLHAPARGNEASLGRALATSNNQCFARLAVDRVGAEGMLAEIDRFGLLRSPALGHQRGMAEVPDDDPLALGRLGSGLAGLEITPLHAVQLAGVLAHGRRLAPHWLERAGIPRPASPGERVVSEALARRLRGMLVDTTRRGTARRAFRTRRGRPLLQGVAVAGKTGSLNGHDPDGRYEWFIGVAPADDPRIAVATLAVQGDLYWMSASQIAAEVFKAALCPRGVCRAAALDRLGPRPVRTAAR